MSSAASIASAIRFSGFAAQVRNASSFPSLRASAKRAGRAFSRSLKSMPLWRTGDPHAPSFSFPAQGAVPRRRFARIVAIGEHDHVAHVAAVDRGVAGPRSKAPPKRDIPSPAWRLGRSRFLHRPSARRRARQGAQRRHGKARASFSADRPVLYRRHRGPEMCDGWRLARRSRRASRAPPSQARCRPRDASVRDENARRRSGARSSPRDRR